MLTYQVFKMLHILGVVLFLGNIIATPPSGKRSPTKRAGRKSSRSANGWYRCDRLVFTLGGVVLILIGGFGMVRCRGPRHR